MKSYFVIALAAIVFTLNSSIILSAQTTPKGVQIKWMSWKEAVEKRSVEEKKILLDVYTEWCYWCKRMDESTFGQPDIARYINENFHAVKFDAETKEDMEYKSKIYKYMRSGKRGYHELAVEFLKGRLSFPTLVFLDENLNVIQSIVGYKDPAQFEQIITYFATNNYKRTPWSTYKTNYKPILVGN